MTTTQLLAQIDAYLKPTSERQYAVVVSRRFLVALRVRLLRLEEAATSPQPINEQTEQIGLAVAEEVTA